MTNITKLTPKSELYVPSTNWVRIMVGYAMTTAVDRQLPTELARAEGYEWFDRWLKQRDEQVASVLDTMRDLRARVDSGDVVMWGTLEDIIKEGAQLGVDHELMAKASGLPRHSIEQIAS